MIVGDRQLGLRAASTFGVESLRYFVTLYGGSGQTNNVSISASLVDSVNTRLAQLRRLFAYVLAVTADLDEATVPDASVVSVPVGRHLWRIKRLM